MPVTLNIFTFLGVLYLQPVEGFGSMFLQTGFNATKPVTDFLPDLQYKK